MSTNSFAVFANETSISLSPEEIERELISMWKPINEAHGASVSRVVLGNVLWLGFSDRLEKVRAIFSRVVPKYPARVFLLEYQRDHPSAEMRAAVNAQCFVPAPGEPPVCCEVIHLAFGPAAARHVRGAVAPLLVPDVQTVLWTTIGCAPFDYLGDLQQHVDRTIRMASLARSVPDQLESFLHATHPTIDLSWFRTTPLREQVTAFFDDLRIGFDLRSIQRVQIDSGTQDPLCSLVAAMFLGWLGSRLGWTAEAMPELIRREVGQSGHRVIRLQDGAGGIFEVDLTAGGMALRCSVAGGPTTERHLRTHELSEEEALGLALNTPSRARHFKEAAALAVPILRRLERPAHVA